MVVIKGLTVCSLTEKITNEEDWANTFEWQHLVICFNVFVYSYITTKREVELFGVSSSLQLSILLAELIFRLMWCLKNVFNEIAPVSQNCQFVVPLPWLPSRQTHLKYPGWSQNTSYTFLIYISSWKMQWDIIPLTTWSYVDRR